MSRAPPAEIFHEQPCLSSLDECGVLSVEPNVWNSEACIETIVSRFPSSGRVQMSNIRHHVRSTPQRGRYLTASSEVAVKLKELQFRSQKN